MAAQPFFSIIIPSFNRKTFVEKAVCSVLAQTYGEFELIIIDDGSEDGTGELIKKYTDKRIQYHYSPNRGVAAARNKGISRAKGPYIAFLDSDDRWTPEKLEKTVLYIKKYPDINIFHTEEIWYKKGELLNQKKRHKKPSGRVYGNALPLCCISISTAVIKKYVFDVIGVFDESFEACEDYDFWLRASSKYKIKLIPEYLTVKDGGRPDQLSYHVWGLDRFRIRALEKMLAHGHLNREDRDLTLKELKNKCRIFSAGSEKRGRTGDAEYYRILPEKYV